MSWSELDLAYSDSSECGCYIFDNIANASNYLSICTYTSGYGYVRFIADSSYTRIIRANNLPCFLVAFVLGEYRIFALKISRSAVSRQQPSGCFSWQISRSVARVC